MPKSVRSGPAAVPAVKAREGGGQHRVWLRNSAPRRGRRAGPGGWVASPGAPGYWRSRWGLSRGHQGGQEAEVGLSLCRGDGPRRHVEVVAEVSAVRRNGTPWSPTAFSPAPAGTDSAASRYRRSVIQSSDLLMLLGLAGTRTGIVTPTPHDGASAGHHAPHPRQLTGSCPARRPRLSG